MSLLARSRSDWPFSAGRVSRERFYYGWVIAALSTLGVLMSIPGQTMGMAVFADEFITAFGLGRTELSTAYLIGTMTSAFFLPRAGRWFDRFGARLLIVSASLALALTLVFIASVDRMAAWLSPLIGFAAPTLCFAFMLFGYFGIRFAGQGVLTSSSRNVLLVWFERRRGLVSGISGVFVSLGFAIAPLLLALLIDAFGWRGALLLLALVVGPLFALVALFFVRDKPAVCGLKVDGGDVDATEPTAAEPMSRQADLADARRDPVFWVYSLSLAMHALFGTAVTFHIVAVFAEAGRGREEAFAYFLPSAIVSVAVNLSASALSDRSRLKPLLLVMLTAFLAGSWGLANLDTRWGYWLLVAGFGSGGGLWGVLANLTFVRQFGARNLGAISGLNTSVTVLASALGPLLFSLANDWLGSFRSAALICMVALVLLFVAAASVRQPHDQLPGRSA